MLFSLQQLCLSRDQESHRGPRRVSQGPRHLFRNQEILPGFRTYSQDLGDPPRIQEVLLGSRRFSQGQGALPSTSLCSAPPFPHHSRQSPDPSPSPWLGEAALTYLTTVFWDSPAASAVGEQSLLRGSVSPCSRALFIFRCLLASPPLATTHRGGVRRCWGSRSPIL